MWKSKASIRFLFAVVAAFVVVGAGCTNDALDDGDSADVVLEITTLNNPPVSASLDPVSGFCTFTVTDWVLEATALPKNALGTDSSPFNDIALQQVTVDYSWLDPALTTPQRTFGLGGITIPVGGNATVNFQPIALNDLSLANQSNSANLNMMFEAQTVEGTRITTIVQRLLTVNGCQ